MTAIARIREEHTQGWASTSDEVWGRPGICLGCGHAWPCDPAALLGQIDAVLVVLEDVAYAADQLAAEVNTNAFGAAIQRAKQLLDNGSSDSPPDGRL